MHWFFVALGAPLLWSLVNHCDKFILSRYFKGGGSGGLMIFVGTIAVPLSIIFYIIDPSVINITTSNILILIVTGLLYNAGVILYLWALEREETSYVVPFWQLVPVFAYILGVVFLGEYLATDKTLAALIVFAGALLLSIEFTDGWFSIDKKTIATMTFSAFFLALGYILFKKSTIDDSSFISSMFWNQIGFLLFGILCYIVPKYRKEFNDVIVQNSKAVLSLNILEQLVETIGVIINNFAVLLAPAALVVLIEYTAQPMFVFIEGIFLTLLFPGFVKEDLTHKNLAQKFISIIIMGIGVYMIT